MAPAELMLRRKPRTKLSLLKPTFIRDNSENKSKPGRKIIYFNEGQNVLAKITSKNEHSWKVGKVVKVVSPVTYLINVDGSIKYLHSDQLRTCRFDLNPDIPDYSEKPNMLQSPTIIEDVRQDTPALTEPLVQPGPSSPPKSPFHSETTIRRSKRTVRPPQRLDL